MQIILILVITVAILAILSGIGVIGGAHKGDRASATIFFFVALCSFLWSISIGIFLALPENTSPDNTRLVVYGVYLPALIMSLGLAAYPCYKYKLGKVMITVCSVFCIGLVIPPLINPNILFSSISLSSSSGNIVHLQHNLYNYLYMGYFIVTCWFYMIGLFVNARKAKDLQTKRANYIVLIGFSITGVIALIFDVILPFLGKYDTIWAGPLSVSISWILHYYAILRYHPLDLSASWLRALSNVIIMALAAIAYLAIFFLVFTALFKVPSPSPSIIILNFILVAAVLLLTPALNELSGFVKSLASTKEIDLPYIVKKLTGLVGYKVNPNELAGFLADHLHFQYVGLLIGGELYGSKPIRISVNDYARLSKINHLKSHDHSNWLVIDDEQKAALRKMGVSAVAELRNSRNEIVGYILLGSPRGNISIKERNLAPIEMTFPFISAVLCPDKFLAERSI